MDVKGIERAKYTDGGDMLWEQLGLLDICVLYVETKFGVFAVLKVARSVPVYG